MLTGTETKDTLLAKWAELLRTGNGLRSLRGCEHVVRYTDELWQSHEYSAQCDDPVVINDLAALFRKDVDLCLDEVEQALAAHGITVTREPSQ